MARSLGYTPPTPPDTGARDELDDLVEALHDTGLLRALAGGARAYPTLLRTLLDAVDADTLRAGIALAGGLRDLDPTEAERLAGGIRRARSEATAAATGKPEGPVALLRRLRDPDTRRGLSAALAALSAIGGALREKG
ncbi:DUF1641 domain-containing protein [Williamsia deligens]|uniref:DUF1641 domain-containing protein n=1 Tax=Williamsia deligens TaxID=321325 RepID=A0ABW3G7W5_9NOCA|nr:DUF1641 domain-containing protein [Williamsia deligens]MCP2194278.1 Uncharacterized conserved protein YjgD, DUF1641 family [Williamsia deligens]